MTRTGRALLTLVGGACLAVGCNGATPRDQNFGTDAQSGFEVPPFNPDAQADGAMAGSTGTVTGVGGDTGLTGVAGDTGALTANIGGAGATAGAGGGAGASSDSGADAASDGAAP